MISSKVVQFHEYGDPDVLIYETKNVSKPNPNEVRIHQTFVGLNFIDIQQRKGRYLAKKLPVTPGVEGVGIIESIGQNITDFRVGDRVAYLDHFPAAYVEYRNINADRVVMLPVGISDEIAASIMLKGLTANYLLRGSYFIKSQDTILVHAAAGGVGLIMSQWARHLGARVIGIVGTEEKVKIAKDSGCDHVIVRSKDDIVSMVMELTGGQGVPVVYDSVGMSTFDISLDCLAKKGTLVSFGTASGPIPPFDIFRLNNNHHLGSGGSKFVTSASVFDYTRDRSEYLARVSDLFEVVQSGAVKISINNKFPLSQANLAHRQLESGTTSGATILEI